VLVPDERVGPARLSAAALAACGAMAMRLGQNFISSVARAIILPG